MIDPDRSSPSPYFNPHPPVGQGVIIHATRSGVSQNPREMAGTLAWFAGAGHVSAHWVIGRDGEKVRVIADNHQAWHAREHNATHWGIELCQGVQSDNFTQEQLQALVVVCMGYRDDFGVPIMHDMHGFIGHDETPAGKRDGKTDPGIYFPWNWFIAALQPAPQAIGGIGIHFVSGKEREIWGAMDDPGETPDGIGIRWSDGTIETVWP